MTFVELERERYDELVRKEMLLENIERLRRSTSGYSFHEVVGYLLKTEAEVKVDE